MPSIDMERFREDINRYRFETDTTWTALAEKAGVSPAMFTRLKKGRSSPSKHSRSFAHHADSTPSTTCRNSKRHRNTKQQRSIQWKKRKDSASTARNSP